MADRKSITYLNTWGPPCPPPPPPTSAPTSTTDGLPSPIQASITEKECKKIKDNFFFTVSSGVLLGSSIWNETSVY